MFGRLLQECVFVLPSYREKAGKVFHKCPGSKYYRCFRPSGLPSSYSIQPVQKQPIKVCKQLGVAGSNKTWFAKRKNWQAGHASSAHSTGGGHIHSSPPIVIVIS